MTPPSPRHLFLLLSATLLLSLGCSDSTAQCDVGCGPDEAGVSCGTDLSCSLGASVCDASSGQCRACAGDSECGGGTPFCKASKCVQCTQDAHCGGTTPFCNGIHCVSCRTSADCGSGLTCSKGGYCTTSCGGDAACPATAPRCYGAFATCVECLSDADCGEGKTCFGNACRQPLPGTSCDSPMALELSSGSARVGGDLRPYWYVTSTFGTNTGFFRFSVTQDVKVNGDLFFEGSVVRGSLSIQKDDCSGVVARTTVDDFSEGAWRLRDVYLAPGTYIATVSQEVVQENLQGPFTLHLWTTPTTRIEGNSCLKPVHLTPDEQGRATVRGSTAGLERIFGYYCGADTVPGRGSLVYELKLPVRSRVRAELVPLTPGMDLRLAWNSTCNQPLSRECATAAGPGGTERLETDPKYPGTYYLLVNDEAGVPGDLEVRVQVDRWSPNDDCQNASPLTFNGQVAEASGDTRLSLYGYCGCNAMTCDQEVSYRLSTVGLGARPLRLEAVSTDPGAAYQPQLSLRTGCAGASSLACDADTATDGTALLEHPALPEGEYVVHVGGVGAGPFTLRATLSP